MAGQMRVTGTTTTLSQNGYGRFSPSTHGKTFHQRYESFVASETIHRCRFPGIYDPLRPGSGTGRHYFARILRPVTNRYDPLRPVTTPILCSDSTTRYDPVTTGLLSRPPILCSDLRPVTTRYDPVTTRVVSRSPILCSETTTRYDPLRPGNDPGFEQVTNTLLGSTTRPSR